MKTAHNRLCLLLHSMPGIDAATLTRMLLHSGSPRALVEAGPPLWCELGLAETTARELAGAIAGDSCAGPVDIEVQLAALDAAGADILPISDSRYPPLLRTIHDPPPLLYFRGDAALLSQAQLAIVGSRKASPAGLRSAAALAGAAAGAGLHVTSGLAQGIDGAAHQGALATGRSIAVMATGIDLVYPARHGSLALALEQAGCLVSEFPPGMPPLQHNFPRRNRIISGLALGVLVVEAALRSGSLISARMAMEQGREVFALPWSICHAGGAGCLQLIRDGAKMVATIEEVLEELGSMYKLQQELLPGEARGPASSVTLSEGQQRLLQLVGYELVTVDELSRLSALPVARLMAELSFLEMQGVLTRATGGYIRT
jgi:DNA processing protein